MASRAFLLLYVEPERPKTLLKKIVDALGTGLEQPGKSFQRFAMAVAEHIRGVGEFGRELRGLQKISSA